MSDTASPIVVNGLFADVLKGMLQKMKESPAMGKDFPVNMKATLDCTTGIVKGPAGLISAPMPHTAMSSVDPNLPTPLSYCPIMASSCFTLVFMLSAANKNMCFDSYVAAAKTMSNMGMFYDKGIAEDGSIPWKELKVDVLVKGPQSKEELENLCDYAHEHCPAAELLTGQFGITTSVKGTTVEVETEAATSGCLNGYDMDKYRAFSSKIAKDNSAAEMEQTAVCCHYCKNDCAEFPDAAMQLIFPNKSGIAIAMDPPVGKGKYPNPIAACFFGAASFYAHTFAIRLSMRNVRIRSLSVTISTKMNKRKMMGVDEDCKIFDSGKVEVEVESSASPDVLEEVRIETDLMCPGIYGLTQTVALITSIKKE